MKVSMIILSLLPFWGCSVCTLRSSKQQIAKIQLAKFDGGLQLFFWDSRRYPNSIEGLEALIRKPANLSTWKGPYLNWAELPKDPWGRPYLYRCPGEHGKYDVFSYGADGKEGGEQDNADVQLGARGNKK